MGGIGVGVNLLTHQATGALTGDPSLEGTVLSQSDELGFEY